MDNYEEKYKEALDRAKILIDKLEANHIKDFIYHIFPELLESNEERIKREILELVSIAGNGNQFEEIKNWLEKQGGIAKLSEEEQNRFAKGVLTSCALSFIDYLDAHKYEGKMCASNGECEDIENAFHNAMWDKLHRYYCKYIEKQGEQKPAWSEEDERNLKGIIDEIEANKNSAPDYDLATYDRFLSWLKSIKQRIGG